MLMLIKVIDTTWNSDYVDDGDCFDNDGDALIVSWVTEDKKINLFSNVRPSFGCSLRTV